MAYTQSQFILSNAPYSGNIKIDATCASSGAGRVCFMLWASNGASGFNGYLFRFSAISGERPGQILKVVNGTASDISVYAAAANASQLSGAHQITCIYHDVIDKFSVFVDGKLIATATDTTYTPNGQIGYGTQVVTGYITNLYIRGHQDIHNSNQDSSGKAIIDFNASHANQGALSKKNAVKLGTDIQDSGGATLADTDVKNTAISIDSAGNINGIGSGAGLSVANNADSVIRAPGGGVYVTSTSSITGALKIRLPQSWTSTMMRFAVEIYEYSTGYMCTLEIGGYNYSSTPAWHNVSARVIGSSNVEYPVRFGHDGTKCCIWIGNPTETWSYPQVRIRDFFAGYSNYSRTAWETGWAISFDTNAATNVTQTVTDTLPGADWSKTARRPANVAVLSGSENIQNTQITVDANGVLQGTGTAGVNVSNDKIGSGHLVGAGKVFPTTLPEDGAEKTAGKSLDILIDGSTYKRTTANEKAGAGNAYSHLDTDGVKGTANVAGRPARLVSRQAHGVFLETFDVPIDDWAVNSTYTGNLTYPANGQAGGKVLNTTTCAWRIFPDNIPYDPSKLYRIRCRVRKTAGAAGTLFYCGVTGVAADGVTLVNTAGDNTYSSQHHACAASANVAVGSAWVEYTGYFKGLGASSTTPSIDPANPRVLHSSVRYIRPHIILSYSAGGDTYELDYVAIDIIPESADVIAESSTKKWAGETGATVGARLGTNLKKSDGATIVTDDDLFLNGLMARTITLSGTGARFRTATSGARIEITQTLIAGYASDGTTKEFYLQASNGKAYAGGGNVILSKDGIVILADPSSGGGGLANGINFYDSTNVELMSHITGKKWSDGSFQLDMYCGIDSIGSTNVINIGVASALGRACYVSISASKSGSPSHVCNIHSDYAQIGGTRLELWGTSRIDVVGPMLPYSNDTYNLGNGSYKWANCYLSQDLILDGNVRRPNNVGSSTLYGGTSIYNGGGILVNGIEHSTNPGNTYVCFGGAAATGACYIRHWNGSAWNISFSTDHRGNVTIGSASFANNGQNCLMLALAVAPTSQVADHFAMYAWDVGAGNACPHFRTENGSIIKLYTANALPAALSNILHVAAGTDTNQMGGGTAGGWGFGTQDTYKSFMARFLNLQQRINQLEARLQSQGLLT